MRTTPRSEFEPIPPVDLSKVADLVTKRRDEWIRANLGRDHLLNLVDSVLSNKFDEMIKKLLGFNTSWGRDWEVDHCNGRNGQSIIADHVREQVRDHVAEVVKEALQGVTLNAPQVKALQKEYREQLVRAMKEVIASQAYTDAAIAFNQIVGGTYEVSEEDAERVPRPPTFTSIFSDEDDEDFSDDLDDDLDD